MQETERRKEEDKESSTEKEPRHTEPFTPLSIVKIDKNQIMQLYPMKKIYCLLQS